MKAENASLSLDTKPERVEGAIIDEDEITDEMMKARETEKKVLEMESKIENVKRSQDREFEHFDETTGDIIAQIKTLERRRKEIELSYLGRKAAANGALEDLQKELDVMEYKDSAPFFKQLEEAREHNGKLLAWEGWQMAEEKINKLRFEVVSLGEKIDITDTKLRGIMADSEFPIKELEIGEDVLIYKGLPFDESALATSELMDVGVKLAVAKKPNAKIIRINQSESLGKERLDQICKFAEDEGYQLFIERVTDDEELIVKIVE